MPLHAILVQQDIIFFQKYVILLAKLGIKVKIAKNVLLLYNAKLVILDFSHLHKEQLQIVLNVRLVAVLVLIK